MVRNHWVRFATPGQTKRFTQTIANAIIRCLDLALDCDHVLLISSGTVFIKEYIVPKEPTIAIETHEDEFPPCSSHEHLNAIPIDNPISSWIYPAIMRDACFKRAILNRGYTHYKGAQWSGQLWRIEVANRLLQDRPFWLNAQPCGYQCEEIYFSTYAYAYAIDQNIPLYKSVVTINWKHQYEYTTNEIFPNAVAICKVADSHAIREMSK